MIKILTLVMVLFLFSGCSVVKWMATPFKNTTSTVPQSSVQGKSIVKCEGELTTKDGVTSCSKNYYAYDYDSNVQERKLTLVERIKGFINGLLGWGFWGVIALVILCPSLLGLIAGRLFEGVYGIGTKAFRQVSSAIQKVKDQTPDLVTALQASTDEDVRKFIKEFKDKNNIK